MDNFCVDCGKKIDKRSKRCRSCAMIEKHARGCFDEASAKLIRTIDNKGRSHNIPPIVKICEKCGEEFRVYPCEVKRKFCSPRCYREYQWGDIPKIIYCKFCGKPFRPQPYLIRQGYGKHCSSECANNTKRTVDGKEKASQSIKAAWGRGCYDNEEFRRKSSEVVKAAWARGCYNNAFTDEILRRRSIAQIEAGKRPELRLQRSVALKAAHARGCYDGVFKSPTIPEIAMKEALETLGFEYVSEFRMPNTGFHYDFCIPSESILLEFDGEYWHHSKGAVERGQDRIDKQKDTLAQELGYELIRVRGNDLKEHEMIDIVRSRIQEVSRNVTRNI